LPPLAFRIAALRTRPRTTVVALRPIRMFFTNEAFPAMTDLGGQDRTTTGVCRALRQRAYRLKNQCVGDAITKAPRLRMA
jgi:hypothetical protein